MKIQGVPQTPCSRYQRPWVKLNIDFLGLDFRLDNLFIIHSFVG